MMSASRTLLTPRHSLPALLLLAGLVGCQHRDLGEQRAMAVKEVESRLFAPCCWMQTLDAHASPLADELRAEVTTRIQTGETPATIEDDLASRYGERIRAVPKNVSSQTLGAPFVVAAALALVALWMLSRRLMGRAARAEVARPVHRGATRAHDLAREDQLDDELREMD